MTLAEMSNVAAFVRLRYAAPVAASRAARSCARISRSPRADDSSGL
jgi:hypothetical protein